MTDPYVIPAAKLQAIRDALNRAQAYHAFGSHDGFGVWLEINKAQTALLYAVPMADLVPAEVTS